MLTILSSQISRKAGFLVQRPWIIPILSSVALLILDFTPRFFQGDSISYLGADGDWLPPDRSWAFGLLVHWLLFNFHNYTTFIILQNCILIGLIYSVSSVFRASHPSWRLIFIIIISIDPIINLYTRFFMSDFLALTFFLTYLLGMLAYFSNQQMSSAQVLKLSLLLTVCLTAAVFTRVAYLAVAEMTGVIFTIVVIAKNIIVSWRRVAFVLAAPLLSVTLLIGANSLAFSKRFPNEIFITKLSGVFLLGVFAPAVTIADFQAAGVEISQAEFDDLKMWDYNRREYQVWEPSLDHAHALIKSKLGIPANYSKIVDATSTKIVLHALRRDPGAVAYVYLKTVAAYFMPAEWRRKIRTESGFDRVLPLDFTAWFNTNSIQNIFPEITSAPSLTMSAFWKMMSLYPVIVFIGVISSLSTLCFSRNIASVILSAALISSVVTLGLFSNYVIPRYAMASIFLSYLVTVHSLGSYWRYRNREKPGGISSTMLPSLSGG